MLYLYVSAAAFGGTLDGMSNQAIRIPSAAPCTVLRRDFDVVALHLALATSTGSRVGFDRRQFAFAEDFHVFSFPQMRYQRANKTMRMALPKGGFWKTAT